MYNEYQSYTCPYYVNTPMRNSNTMYNVCTMYPCPYCANAQMYNLDYSRQFANQYIAFTDEIEDHSRFDYSTSRQDNNLIQLKDYGPEPFVVNIDDATKQNNTYRTALWTGPNLQVTLMSIGVGEDIGLEVHPEGDQFIRIEEGEGLVRMGNDQSKLDFQQNVDDDFAIMIPAGKWHNVINTGDKPLKLYVIYAPPEHPHGTVHQTKAMAEAAEQNQGS